MNPMHKRIVFIAVSLILLLPACGEKLTALKTSNVDNIFPSAGRERTATPPPAPPAAVTDALLPNFDQT